MNESNFGTEIYSDIGAALSSSALLDTFLADYLCNAVTHR